ncbi:hypothetical protein AB0J52_40005, partial [Spirillospora sp. NPDC049652]
MTEEDSANSVLTRRYRRLVRIAYLVLPDQLDRHDRVVLAHWIVGRARPRRDHRGAPEAIYAALRRRVLRRALRSAARVDRLGPRTERIRSGSWLRVQPLASDGDPQALHALAALSPQARAAYALLRLEDASEDETRAELAALGVSDPDGRLAEAAALPALGDAAGRVLDPAVVGLHARRVSSPLAAARELHRRPGGRAALNLAAVTAVAAIAVTGGALRPHHARLAGDPGADARGAGVGGVVMAPDDLWRRSARLELTAWPARGDLVRDRGFVARAVRAWEAGAHPASDSGGPQLLFAGTVATRRVALLRDGGVVARYTDAAVRGDEGGGGGDPGGGLEVFPVGRSQPDGESPLKVAPGRYLMPPWVTAVRAADLASGGTDGDAAWRPVPVRDGLTDAVPRPPGAGRGGCWRGPVLELSRPQVPDGRPYTVADLGGLVSADLLYQPPSAGTAWPHPVGGGPGALPAGFALWRA